MSNNINHEIKTIVAELQSMSPRTQLEIVRLCKRVAELTPDYIEALSREDLATFSALLETAKTQLQSQITTNANDIDTLEDNIEANTTAINNEKTAREDVIGVNTAGNTYIKTAAENKQILMYNNGLISLQSYNNNVDITAPSGFARISTDNSSIMASEQNGVTLSTNETEENPNIIILRPNGDFEVSNEHTLKFDNTGALTIDGAEVGGGYNLYEHHVILILSRVIGGITYTLRFNVYFLSTDGNNVDLNFIRNWLYINKYRANSEAHWPGELTISGVCYECGIYSEMNTHIRCRYWNGTSMTNDIVDNEIVISAQSSHKINN